MCLGAPPPVVQQQPAQQVVSAPPAPPARDPNPPMLAPEVDAERSTAAAKKKGTSIFRNDLSIPVGNSSGIGTGLNIPR